jgi:diguanylate cyclase (GGDEF)-like protein
MSQPSLKLLCVQADAAVAQALGLAGMGVTAVTAVHEAWATPGHFDAVLFVARTMADLRALRQRSELPGSALERAWVVCTHVQDDALEAELLSSGVECIVAPLDDAALARQVRHAVARKQLERAARTAYATDLATGLPHHAQLVEHMTQLLALREREPAPMVLLVLRVDGFAQAAARLGVEAGNVLRRKVAVRLRGGLRASDVVAAIGPDAFAVLLGRLEHKGDGDRVAAKLVQTLQQTPLLVAGQPCPVSATVGLALYPDHGKTADALLKRASAQAGSVATVGSEGFAAPTFRSGGAANDPT